VSAFLGTVLGAPGSPNGPPHSLSSTIEHGRRMFPMVACGLDELLQDAILLFLARPAVASLELTEVTVRPFGS